MPSYTSSLRLIQPTTGEYSGTWGTQVNNGITALVDNAVAGTATIEVGSTDYTLSTANGATDEARAAVLNLTAGVGVGARNVICPAVSKLYVIVNNSGFTQTIKTAAGTGVAVPTGRTTQVRCDGTDVVEVTPLNVSSDNVNFLQSGTGAVTRTAQSKFRETVSVKDFGAVGDGVTNDYTAVLNALTAGKGKAVYFPAGTYLLNSSITMDSTFSNTDIYGDGTGTVIKTGSSATQATFYIRQVSNLSIRSLKFDGNSAAQSSSSARLVQSDRASSNLSFYDVWFFNSYSDNVSLIWTSGFGAVNTVNFTDCRFDTATLSSGSNVLLRNTENITFQGCYFTNWIDSAIDVEFSAPTVNGGLIVDSCYFQNTNSDAYAILITAGDNVPGDKFYRIKNVNITNNVFDANNRSTLGASGIGGFADYACVIGNTWRRSDSGSWRQGVQVSGNYWTISNNVFDDSSIVFETFPGVSNGTNFVVTNNSVRNAGNSTTWGIQFGKDGTFDGVLVANNIIELVGVSASAGAILAGTFDSPAILTNTRITNNILSHDSTVSSVNGIRLACAAGSQNIIIDQNTLVNFDNGILSSASTATDVTVSNNTLRNCTTNISLNASVTARVFGNNYSASYALVSPDRGDASVTIVPGVDAPTQQFATPLTTNRTVTLSSTNAFTGASFRVVRTAAATGASTLNVGGLKTLAAGEWAVVEYTGSAWLLTGFGAL